MKFIPNSSIKDSMIKELGISKIDDLFLDVPKQISINNLNLESDISQQEVEHKLRKIGNKNKSFCEMPYFLGGGIKPHYIPAIVKSIISRSEFYTSYTPYQSEASQGFLQAMFEYQSIIAELTGMDIANASLYDGATAVGEVALMSTRINKKKSFIVPKNISRDKRGIVKNYTFGAGIKIKEIDYDKKTGKIDVKSLKNTIDEKTAGVYIENPNYFGIFENEVEDIRKLVHENESIFVVGIDPLSLGIIKSPGDYGADIVIGEGRSLGNPVDFGGSALGLFACRKEYLRQVPGRIIGLTTDAKKNKAFCMTLQTREQHIRRGKATSNICTNEGINALAAVVYLSWLGSDGLETLSKVNFEKGQYLEEKICEIQGFEKVFSGIHFNEFVLKHPNPKKLEKILLKNNIQGGLLLENEYPELKNCILFGITEKYDSDSIDKLLSVLRRGNHV
jgi:glycine dehydrogenase subunit 1